MCVYVCVCVCGPVFLCVYHTHTYGNQKKVLDTMEMELQENVALPFWILGTNLSKNS